MELDVDAVRGAAKAINDMAEQVPSAVAVNGNGSGAFDDFAAAAANASARAQNALARLGGAIKTFSDELSGFATAVQLTDEDAAKALSTNWNAR